MLKCRTTADFLAALPRLTGFTAADSLFVVFFSGKQAGQVMRVSLPASEEPHLSLQLLDFLCEALREIGEAHGALSAPAIVISSSQTFAEAGGAPWRRFAKRIERRLRRERIGVRELCCLAPDGWISYLDPAAPQQGRPLSEISESSIAREVAEEGPPVPDLMSLGALPIPDARRVAAVAEALDGLTPYDFPAPAADPLLAVGAGKPSPDGDRWLGETAAVGRALRGEQRRLSPRMTARLIRTAAHADRWLVLALGILTRPEFPAELAAETEPVRFANVPIDIDTGRERTPVIGWSIRRILASISPDFEDRERLPGIRVRLLAALSECPAELRPGLYALSAWVWWLAGNQTVALRHVEEALAIESEHELVRMVERLVEVPVCAGLLAPRYRPRAA